MNVKSIEIRLSKYLKETEIGFSENVVCKINSFSVTIGIKTGERYMDWGSDLDLCFDRSGVMTINFGTRGSFTPSDIASYWRTIHAALILENWEQVSRVVKIHFLKAKELERPS